MQRTDNLRRRSPPRPRFGGDVALVRRLVRRFDMHADHVGRRQRFDCVASFGGVVGIRVTRRAGDFDRIPSRSSGDASQQVDRRDHLAARTVCVMKAGQLRAFGPVPTTRHLWRAACRRHDAPDSLDGIGKACTLCSISSLSRSLPGPRGKSSVTLLVRQVMRRRAASFVRERRRPRLAAIDQQVAVADPWDELQRRIGRQS